MSETKNPFRLSNPSARDIVVEFDDIVKELEAKGLTHEEAEGKAKSIQKEKYGTQNLKSSSENQ